MARTRGRIKDIRVAQPQSAGFRQAAGLAEALEAHPEYDADLYVNGGFQIEVRGKIEHTEAILAIVERFTVDALGLAKVQP